MMVPGPLTLSSTSYTFSNNTTKNKIGYLKIKSWVFSSKFLQSKFKIKYQVKLTNPSRIDPTKIYLTPN